MVANLLRCCDSIMSLNIGHNEIGDVGTMALLKTLVQNGADLFDDAVDAVDDVQVENDFDEDEDGGSVDVPVIAEVTVEEVAVLTTNSSLTSMNLMSNDITSEAIEVLVEVLKTNVCLVSLNLGMNPKLRPKELKHAMHALRYVCTSFMCLYIFNHYHHFTHFSAIIHMCFFYLIFPSSTFVFLFFTKFSFIFFGFKKKKKTGHTTVH